MKSVKKEPQCEQEEDYKEVVISGDYLNIQIKEEPLLHEVSEGQNRETTDALDSNGDGVTSKCELAEYASIWAAVKEEAEPRVKEENNSESEDGSCMGKVDLKEEVCSGRSDNIVK